MRVKIWLRALRAPFFQASIIPVVLGTSVAWYKTGVFYPGYFLVALLGAVSLHAGANLANDYFDHKTGADELNQQPTPFSGGSRVIQQGLITPQTIYRASLLFIGLGSLAGMYLVWTRGWPILVIGLIGVLSAYYYTSGPLKIGYRGFGELLVGLNFGPLMVLGAYFVQAANFSMDAFAASLPVGLLIAAILYINEFPDYNADKAAGKKTLIVKIGPEKAVKGYYFLLTLAYLSIVAGSLTGMIPWAGLLCLATLPLAYKSIKMTRKNYADTKAITPAMANTVGLHLAMGLLLSAAYLVTPIVRL